ncbi:hypothetical protein J2T55_001490 [Methylohalomonas lacus]|uniref:Pyridoxamine 5'-phosphate oxidase Alr4036 family FMN-binding domain-containing protein n=1 Tax=Methylohalomonas lacus TaxID=398773 RepID=A0AAE3HJE5_9GAMM|nr:pyridoxamine 5'-phosphate oxidase family protein [Methylohalomonas lacus]MCS3903469.1 hypothetical protein [Methylohalomonas lacus]
MSAADFYDDLDAAFAHAWQQLARAVADRRHGFRVIQLATTAADGTPRVRSVVLRAVTAGQLQFHTDSRSAKLTEIAAQPRVALHAYDARDKLQLRLLGSASRHDQDDRRAAAWAATQEMSRVCYRIQPAPGTPIANPHAVTHAMPQADPDPGYRNFTVVSVTVDRLEWLYLAAAGHRRARWQRCAGGDDWSGHWLAP